VSSVWTGARAPQDVLATIAAIATRMTARMADPCAS
jgi:hypothetical protein